MPAMVFYGSYHVGGIMGLNLGCRPSTLYGRISWAVSTDEANLDFAKLGEPKESCCVFCLSYCSPMWRSLSGFQVPKSGEIISIQDCLVLRDADYSPSKSCFTNAIGSSYSLAPICCTPGEKLVIGSTTTSPTILGDSIPVKFLQLISP